MPYRRLPNTDHGRIKALELAVEKNGYREDGKLVLPYKLVNDASAFLDKFKQVHQLYQQSFDIQVKANKKYQKQVKTVRLYISHFIQVLNMSIIRNEIKRERKKLYGLESYGNQVPDLTTEASLLKWGDAVIRGESERVVQGGVPIYNPTIAKVKVQFSIFSDGYYNQKNLQNNTLQYQEKIALMRDCADELILQIWNHVEEIYAELPLSAKLNRCREFGVVYYYRPKEKQAIMSEKLQKKLDFND